MLVCFESMLKISHFLDTLQAHIIAGGKAGRSWKFAFAGQLRTTVKANWTYCLAWDSYPPQDKSGESIESRCKTTFCSGWILLGIITIFDVKFTNANGKYCCKTNLKPCTLWIYILYYFHKVLYIYIIYIYHTLSSDVAVNMVHWIPNDVDSRGASRLVNIIRY